MIGFPTLIVALGLPVLVLGFRAFGALVALERAHHLRAWVADGRPGPVAWFGPASLRGWLATQRCMVVWTFKTPEWVNVDGPALVGDPRIFRTDC